jgi:hypothetical protein
MKKPALHLLTRSHEADLLFCCARTRMDEAVTEKVRSLAGSDLDWDFIVDRSCQHRVLPLLHRNLFAVCPDLVPPRIFEVLSNLYRENEIRNHRLAAELVRILNLLEIRGIPVVPFKGPVLALELYKDLALRQCDDLDLLVLQRDVPAVEEFLISRGYVPELKLGKEARLACLSIHDEYTYCRTNPEITIDIHWRLVPKSYAVPFDLTEVFRQLDIQKAAGASTLPPETLLLILCLHGYMHRWQRLCWVSDISELVLDHPEIRWELALKQASDLGCRRILLLAFCLIHTLFNIRIPESIDAAVQADTTVKRLCLEIAACLSRMKCSSPGWLTLAYFQARAREQVQDKIRFWYRFALSPTALDYLGLRLPPSLAYLYPLLRPLRLARKFLQ